MDELIDNKLEWQRGVKSREYYTLLAAVTNTIHVIKCGNQI